MGEVAFIGGQSMYPYLNASFNEGAGKDLCWVNKWNPTKDLKRGMVVTFWLGFSAKHDERAANHSSS